MIDISKNYEKHKFKRKNRNNEKNKINEKIKYRIFVSLFEKNKIEILDSILLFLLFNFLQNESINNFDLLKSVLSEYSLFVLRTTSNACYSKIINSMPLLCKLNLKKTMNFFIHNL